MKDDPRSSTAPLAILPAPVRGLISFVLLSLNTVVCSLAIFPLAVVKLIAPVARVRRRVDRLLHGVIERWIAGNGVWIALTGNATWIVEGVERLRIDGWWEACEKFRLVPTTLASFLEGTRFTPEKHASQESPYRHLLRPRAGGLALALDSMGEQFEALLDITIFYPDGAPTFFEFLSGRAERVVVQVRERSVPPELTRGDYANDPEFRERVREWINEIWAEKDQSLHRARRQGEGGEAGGEGRE